jgi:hypothetical protein
MLTLFFGDVAIATQERSQDNAGLPIVLGLNIA